MKKKLDPRLMLITSMTVFGTLGLFVRNIPVSSGELALYRAVLAALLALCLWNGHLLTQRCEDWTAQLRVIDGLAEADGWDAAQAQLQQLYDDWQQAQTWLHITTEHDALNEAEELFCRTIVLAEEADTAEFRAHVAELRSALQLLQEMEQLRVENVL